MIPRTELEQEPNCTLSCYTTLSQTDLIGILQSAYLVITAAGEGRYIHICLDSKKVLPTQAKIGTKCGLV